MIGAVLVALHFNSFHLFKMTHKVDNIIISVFLRRKLSLREVTEVVYSHLEKARTSVSSCKAWVSGHVLR